MLSERIEALGFRHIVALRDNKIPEGRTLEYKRELHGRSDDERRELVADVTAFANAEGGEIIFGISEGEDGAPGDFVGVSVEDRDAEERRLSDTIRTGTEPRYSAFEFKWVETPEGKPLLVLRVPRSWRGPHRVTLRGHDKFYIRDARGKHPMNTDELRVSFGLAETLSERIRNVRKDRIAIIRNGESPLPLVDGPIAVLHLVPLVSIVDPPFLKFDEYEITPRQMEGGSGSSYLQTLDGKVSFGARLGDEPVSSYTLLFRSGIIEAVLSPSNRGNGGHTEVAVGYLEQCLVEYFSSYISYLEKKDIGGPYYLLLSLLEAQGTVFVAGSGLGRAVAIQRRSELIFPELVINVVDQNVPLASTLRPLCDLLWNSFGYSRSLNFTAEGEWKPYT
jgi:hypothetical protein